MPDSYAFVPEIWTGDSDDQSGMGSLSVEKVDVSPTSIKFRTCGGTHEGNLSNVSETTIQRDLEKALDWLYHKRRFTMRSNIYNGYDYTVDLRTLNGREPLERIETTDNNVNNNPNRGLFHDTITRTVFESGFAVESFNILGSETKSILTRMYNGSTSDEDNFIGYGVSGFTSTISNDTFITGTDVKSSVYARYHKATGRNVAMRVCSYANITNWEGTGDAYARVVFENVVLDDINFICLASGSTYNIGTPPPVVNIGISGAGGVFGITMYDGSGGSHPINFISVDDWSF